MCHRERRRINTPRTTIYIWYTGRSGGIDTRSAISCADRRCVPNRTRKRLRTINGCNRPRQIRESKCSIGTWVGKRNERFESIRRRAFKDKTIRSKDSIVCRKRRIARKRSRIIECQ